MAWPASSSSRPCGRTSAGPGRAGGAEPRPCSGPVTRTGRASWRRRRPEVARGRAAPPDAGGEGTGRDPQVAPEPAGEVRLVGEATGVGDLRGGLPPGEPDPRLADAREPQVEPRGHPELRPEEPVQVLAREAHLRCQLAHTGDGRPRARPSDRDHRDRIGTSEHRAAGRRRPGSARSQIPNRPALPSLALPRFAAILSTWDSGTPLEPTMERGSLQRRVAVRWHS